MQRSTDSIQKFETKFQSQQESILEIGNSNGVDSLTDGRRPRHILPSNAHINSRIKIHVEGPCPGWTGAPFGTRYWWGPVPAGPPPIGGHHLEPWTSSTSLNSNEQSTSYNNLNWCTSTTTRNTCKNIVVKVKHVFISVFNRKSNLHVWKMAVLRRMKTFQK